MWNHTQETLPNQGKATGNRNGPIRSCIISLDCVFVVIFMIIINPLCYL